MSMLRPALTLAALFLWAGTLVAAECKPPRAPEATILGMTYCVDPAFAATIATRVQQIRADVRAQRQAGKFIIYASTPISSRGGGNERINLEVSASVKARLEREYGPAVWVLDPGAYQMPPVGGRSPGGARSASRWRYSSPAVPPRRPGWRRRSRPATRSAEQAPRRRLPDRRA